MRTTSEKILPNFVEIFIVVICILLSGFLILIGYEGNPPITPHPIATFLGGIAVLVCRFRTIFFGDDYLYIRCLLPILNRKLLLASIDKIEVVDNSYIFIVLDGCTSFREAGQSPKAYILNHPFKLVVINIYTLKQKKRYIKTIKKHYPDLDFVGCEKE